MLARISIAAIITVLVSACAAPVSGQYHGASFLTPARDVSSVFLTPGGDVFLVPEKGVLVQDVRRPDGVPLDWRVQGSYLVIPAPELHAVNAVDLLVNGKLRRQSLRVFADPSARPR